MSEIKGDKQVAKFYYSKSERSKIIELAWQIHCNVSSGKPTKASLLKEFINLFEFSETAEFEIRKKHIDEVKDDVIAYFGHREAYNFTIRTKEVAQRFEIPPEILGKPKKQQKAKKGIEVVVEYDLKRCLDYVFSSLLFSSRYTDIIQNVEQFMPFLYSRFKEYIKPLPRNTISDYAITVMVGFISDKFGLIPEEVMTRFKDGFTYTRTLTSFLAGRASHYIKTSEYYKK